ncbi:MAG: ZIP family metal transporter [Candidatus Daviesbacteria bacterium]|nr:ZIP family metal transporter [Candidatus Daviesbacteria bacterium]
MGILAYIIIFTLIGSVVSLIGGILLLVKQKFALRISHYLSSFAAGALLSAAFFDLLPEAIKYMEEGRVDINLPLWVLIGILTFFLLERFIHHHHDHTNNPAEEKKTIIPLVVIGDTVHNFTDGMAIAATFLISIPLGIVTSLAVAAHEIPQEMGDFGLMLNKGLERKKVLLINLFSSLAALAGAILIYLYQESLEKFLPVILALTAGFFIYIALANLIPEIHNQDNQKVAFWETIMLLLGVLVVYLAISALEGRV